MISLNEKTPEVITVLVVDDHPLLRKGIVNVIEAEDGMAVAGEAENGTDALTLARKLRPDVVVMDVNLPEVDGIAATRAIKKEWPGMRVIGFSTYEGSAVADEMRKAGADAYLSKSAPTEELIRAILS